MQLWKSKVNEFLIFYIHFNRQTKYQHANWKKFTTPVLEPLFNKVTDLHAWCFPVNVSKLLRRPFFTEQIQVTAPGRFSVKNVCFNTGKHLRFCNKVASSEPLTLLKKRLRHEYFPVNFGNLVLWAPFWKHGSERLLWIKLVSNTFFGNYWSKNKAIEAKIHIHENQIHLINSEEIYHLRFLKERLRTGERREPTTTCSTNEFTLFL